MRLPSLLDIHKIKMTAINVDFEQRKILILSTMFCVVVIEKNETYKFKSQENTVFLETEFKQ